MKTNQPMFSSLASPGQILLLLIFTILASSPAAAAVFQVEPTAIELDSRAKSGALTVINGDKEKLTVQISVKEWTQDAAGTDQYADTEDIVFFPKIMAIAPNEQRAVRIGIKSPPSLKEKTYRLFVEEIQTQKKPADVTEKGKIAAGLNIAFRYAVPVFLKPVNQQESASVEQLEIVKGMARAAIRNTGNMHVKLLTVTFQGKAADGKELFSREIAGWYILHSLSRFYEVAVPPEVCEGLATIDVKAQAENMAVSGSVNVRREMCTKQK